MSEIYTVEWPKDGRPISIENLVDPLHDAYEQIFNWITDLNNISEYPNIVWRGPNFSPEMLAVSDVGSLLESLMSAAISPAKVESFEITPIDPKEDHVYALLLTAVRLGICQGRRVEAQENRVKLAVQEGVSTFNLELVKYYLTHLVQENFPSKLQKVKESGKNILCRFEDGNVIRCYWDASVREWKRRGLVIDGTDDETIYESTIKGWMYAPE